MPSTAGQVWTTGNVWLQLPSKFRLLFEGEANIGTDYDYQQWIGGIGLGYQWRHVGKLGHMININSDKESRLVFGGGYEYLWTEQEGKASVEDRAVIDATPRYRPAKHLLIDFRNRVEFRWVDGDYSSRYRARFTLERDIRVGQNGRLTPYASAEFFYEFSSGTIDKEQYAVGLELPFRRIFMLQAYYLFQNNSSAPDNVNVLGITLNLFLRNGL